MSTESRSILSALVVVAIIVGGVYWWKERAPDEPAQNISRDNVEVENFLAHTGAGRVPGGLPAGLPLETENVRESLSQNYVEKGVILSSYAYITSKTPAEVLASYKVYFNDNGFIIGEEAELKGVSFIRARKTVDDILIMVSEKGAEVEVKISYTDR